VVEDVVADLRGYGEPTIEEDMNAEACVEGQPRAEIENAVVGIDHRDWARADRTNATNDVSVVLKDEVAEARELTDQWSIREVERRTPLILGQRHVDASGPASVEVELRV